MKLSRTTKRNILTAIEAILIGYWIFLIWHALVTPLAFWRVAVVTCVCLVGLTVFLLDWYNRFREHCFHLLLTFDTFAFSDVVTGRSVYNAHCKCGKKWLTDSRFNFTKCERDEAEDKRLAEVRELFEKIGGPNPNEDI